MKSKKNTRKRVTSALVGAGFLMSGGLLNGAAASGVLNALENGARLPYAKETGALQLAQCKGCAGARKGCCGAKKGCCGAKKGCCGAKKGCCGAKKGCCGAKKGCCAAKPKQS
ncbi:MAG: hypothetical protein SFV19_18995 [Rhodospirillaceae bacterium]|nr:hypothetical protein [Rhodospirillaceae bacterium]